MGVNVIDLRGRGGHIDGASVLADPSGRRRRRLTRTGRIVAGALVAWLCGLVVAGLGLLPAPIVPFVSAVDPQSSPPRLDRLPAPRPPSVAELRPAAPASKSVSGTRASGAPGAARAPIGQRDTPGVRSRGGHRPVFRKPARSGSGDLDKATPVPTQNGPAQPAGGAPGQLGTAGPSEAAPGLPATAGTGTARSPGKAEPSGTAGKSGSAPGLSSGTTTTQTTTSPSLPGASGSAPGHTEVHSDEQTTPAPKR